VVRPRLSLQEGHSGVSRQVLFQTALVINVLVGAAILALMSILALHRSPPPPSTLGALYFVAAVQVLAGAGLSLLLFLRRQGRPYSWRPVFAFSASLNLVEAVILGAILALGLLS
jgi:MFS superfamily sulfate permease-like transporter